MKKFLFVIVSAAALLAFFSCASETRAEAAADHRPSGRIVIYTSIYTDVIESLDWALQRQFPNVRVDFVYGGTGHIQSRVAAEIAAGRLGADLLLIADPSYSLQLKRQGILHPFASRSASMLAFDFDPSGYWYPVRVSNMVLAFNPLLHDRNSIPNSFYDFANDPSLRGEISMSNPLTSGTAKAAITALLDRYGYRFFEALGRQDIAIESGAVALSKLESGERKVVMVLEESVLRKRQEEMSRLEVIFPADGTIIIPSTIMVVSERWSANRNTGTAEIIADWFLSPEGQSAIVDGWMHSVRKNFRRIPFDSIPINHIQANSMPFNWENSFRQREEILTAFEELVVHGRR